MTILLKSLIESVSATMNSPRFMGIETIGAVKRRELQQFQVTPHLRLLAIRVVSPWCIPKPRAPPLSARLMTALRSAIADSPDADYRRRSDARVRVMVESHRGPDTYRYLSPLRAVRCRVQGARSASSSSGVHGPASGRTELNRNALAGYGKTRQTNLECCTAHNYSSLCELNTADCSMESRRLHLNVI